jgi:hypothetical protein
MIHQFKFDSLTLCLQEQHEVARTAGQIIVFWSGLLIQIWGERIVSQIAVEFTDCVCHELVIDIDLVTDLFVFRMLS